MKLKKGFVDCNGNYYDNVYVLDNKNIGKVENITTTHNENADDFYADDTDFLRRIVYRSLDYPNMCIRLYGDYGFSNMPFPGSNKIHLFDLVFISEIIKRKDKINGISVPYGIVVNNDHVIGDLSRFWRNYKNLNYAVIDKEMSKEKLLLIYKKILKILNDLSDAGIFYRDVHPGNFMISPDLDNVKIIDFDPNYVDFDVKSSINVILFNFNFMVNRLNSLYQLDMIKGTNSFDSALNQIEEILVKVRKK